ncbi:MAG: response regulator [Bryobacteraceae bacterium]|nr:response regulator [Bryobacteraceae bacterium]
MAKILLVDDDPSQIELRRLLFEKAGHTVVCATGEADALPHLRTASIDVVVMDLHLPRTADGTALIRQARLLAPETRVVVMSGFAEDLQERPEASMVDAVVRKPIRSQKLLATVAKLAILLLCLSGARAQQKSDFPFQLDSAAEVVAELDLSAPDADWGRQGRESVLAVLTLDGAKQQNVMVYAGAQRHRYAVFLGPLEPGAHQVKIERHPDLTPRGLNLAIHGVTYREYKPQDADYAVIASAPVLFARANTLRKFSDIPLLTYCERLPDGSLRYSVIFSNEDGGTSTRALMARWGRATDIEHVYQVWPDKAGNAVKSLIQTRDHKDVPFQGQRDGQHPLLGVVTDNNMVGEGRTSIRYQLAPVVVTLNSASREQVMDEHPLTYLISARELEREGKLRKFGAFEGTNISNPENYLFVEARVVNKGARLAVLVRLEGDNFFRSSHLGVYDMAIERSGWVRTAIELPPATQPAQVAEIALQCLPEAKSDGSGTCRVETISKMFFLDASQRPAENFFRPQVDRGPWIVPAGHTRTIAVRNQ